MNTLRNAATEIPLTFPDDHDDPEQRYRLYRLCECGVCGGTGKRLPEPLRCLHCRGEGRMRELVASAGTPEGVGTAIVQLGREGEFAECPFGLLDTQGEKGQKWLINPWLPSPRNISDAAKVLRAAPRKGER